MYNTPKEKKSVLLFTIAIRSWRNRKMLSYRIQFQPYKTQNELKYSKISFHFIEIVP